MGNMSADDQERSWNLLLPFRSPHWNKWNGASLCVTKSFTRTRQGKCLISGLSPDEVVRAFRPGMSHSPIRPGARRLAGFRLLDFTSRLSLLAAEVWESFRPAKLMEIWSPVHYVSYK